MNHFKALMSTAYTLLIRRAQCWISVIDSPRTAELSWITLHPSFGAESRELYECCESFFVLFVFLSFLQIDKAASIFLSVHNTPVTRGLGVFRDVTLTVQGLFYHCLFKVVICSDLVCGFSGGLCRECRWISDFIAAQTGWHQSQQARHESAAFCCHGKIWNLVIEREHPVVSNKYWSKIKWVCSTEGRQRINSLFRE